MNDGTDHTVYKQKMCLFFPVSQQPGSVQGFGVNGMAGGDPGVTMTHPMYPAQPGSAHKMMVSYPPPPSYCNHPPPPYEQVFQNSDKKWHLQKAEEMEFDQEEEKVVLTGTECKTCKTQSLVLRKKSKRGKIATI